MNISGITTNIANKSIKLLSGLGDNDNSIEAMVVKDWIGDAATVYTYKKDGGKDDAREKAIEEFGTGAVWLFGIPLLKQGIDVSLYKAFKLNPKFDARLLEKKSADALNQMKTYAKGAEKTLYDTLDDINPVIQKFFKNAKENKFLSKFTNANLYKNFAKGKFLVATAISAVALNKIIKYKQKTTMDRINADNASHSDNLNSMLVMNSVKNNKNFTAFTSNKNKSNNISFTGFGLSDFMYNPILNTSLLDCVIAGTRLKEARKGERLEIGFKELCQVAFTYGLAKPIQIGFEKRASKKGLPIELDPQVLFTKDIAKQIADSKSTIEMLKKSDDVIADLMKLNVDDTLVSLLVKDNVISLSKDKQSISCLKGIDADAIKKTLSKFTDLEDHIGNLSKIKAYKTFAVIANVLIAAGALGIVQPKVNIAIRKLLHNGDNRNPAIVAQEEKIKNDKKLVQQA